MKKTAFLIFNIILSSVLVFSQNEKNYTITDVIFYLNKAQIKSFLEISLKKGENTVTLKNLSPHIDASSLKISFSNPKVEVRDFYLNKNYLFERNHHEKVKKIKDSITYFKDQIEFIQNEKNALNVEKNFIVNNEQINWGASGVDITKFKSFAEYKRNRVLEINNSISALNKKQNILEEKLMLYEKQFSQLDSQGFSRFELILNLNSPEEAGNCKIFIEYTVQNCYWKPFYDLKIESLDQPVKLQYKAEIYNGSEIDFSNVNVKLSTYQTLENLQIPIFHPIYASEFNPNQYYYQNQNYLQISKNQLMNTLGDVDIPNDEDDEDENLIQENTIELATEFEIPQKITIQASSRPVNINIDEFSLKPVFEHMCLPSESPDCYLIAKISGWNDLNLVYGLANIYYLGSYLGQSIINPQMITDTLEVTLGIDPKVIVKKTKLPRFESYENFGTKKKITFSYNYEIKNFHKTNINCTIIERFPISTKEDIEVKPIETFNGNLDTKTGKITWKFNLKANENIKFSYSYYIKHPKNIKVTLK